MERSIHAHPQFWRALRAIMHLHEKRPIKRAGEAGVALRATGKECLYCDIGIFNSAQQNI
ncbi:hypothetical protein QJR29_02725 [Yersinia enterocolitica]